MRLASSTVRSCPSLTGLAALLVLACLALACQAQSPEYGAVVALQGGLPTFQAGQTVSVPLTVRNTGSLAWNAQDDLVRLSYHWLREDGSTLTHDGQRTPIPANFREGPLTAQVLAPDLAGRFILEFDLVHEGRTWFAEKGVQTLRLPVDVAPADPSANLYAYEMRLKRPIPGLKPGQKYVALLQLANTSGQEWEGRKRNINLSYHWLAQDDTPVVFDNERLAIPDDFREGTLELPIQAPSQVGEFVCEIDLVHEGVTWFKQKGATPLRVTVRVSPQETGEPAAGPADKPAPTAKPGAAKPGKNGK